MSNPYAPPSGSERPAGSGTSVEDAPRPASAAWATILSLLALGTGHVYAGRARRGFGYVGAGVLAVAIWGVLVRPSYLALGIFGMLLTGLLPFGVYIHAAYDAGKRARDRVRRVPVLLVVVALVGFTAVRSLLGVGLRAFFIEAFKIPSGAVVPTLVVGDHMFTDKWTPHFRPPERGELVVFPFPEHPEQDFVKRVVALPGDTVEVGEGNDLTIDGWHVPRCKLGRFQYRDEVAQHDGDVWMEFLGDGSYLVFDDRTSPPESGTWHVPAGQAWVMGDNRNNSHDSRMWYGGQGGGVPLPTVRAFALTIWMSVNERGESDTSRFGADLTGRNPLAPAGMAEAAAKCIAKRPKGNLRPPT
jgi:signal peptidase I